VLRKIADGGSRWGICPKFLPNYKFLSAYFCCPECDSKSQSKQDFVSHASNDHPWALVSLQQISDGSLDDVEFPNDSQKIEEDMNDDFDLPTDYVQVDMADGTDTVRKKKVKKNHPTCQLCNKGFRDNYILNRHIKFHIKAGELPPESIIPTKKRVKPIKEIEKLVPVKSTCPAKFEKKIHDCKECNKIFKTGRDLRRHEQVHLKARQLITLPDVPNPEDEKTDKGTKISGKNLGEEYSDYLKDFFKYESAVLKENGKVGTRYSCLTCHFLSALQIHI
jgi:rubredoxin